MLHGSTFECVLWDSMWAFPHIMPPEIPQGVFPFAMYRKSVALLLKRSILPCNIFLSLCRAASMPSVSGSSFRLFVFL